MTEGLRRTSLYDEHRAANARMVPFAGWEMPVQYEGVVKEHQAVRERAGLFDVSHMGELELMGNSAVDVVDALVTNDVRNLPVGRALYTVCCNDRGTILDDLIIYRTGQEQVLVVCNSSNRAKISTHFANAAKGACEFEDRSDQTALLALQGPRAKDVLQATGASNALHTLSPFHLGTGAVAGVACVVARTGYTGEDGFEIFCAWNEAPGLWRALLEAGKAGGLQPAGLGARDTLRLEARLALYGNDIDETTNPFEAGLGWVVKLDKGEFVGCGALTAIKQTGVSRKLVGFEMTERGIARHGYAVLDGRGERIGEVTSGSPGPTVGKNIGLAYVPTTHSEVGAPLHIQVRDKIIAAQVVKTPFYKRRS